MVRLTLAVSLVFGFIVAASAIGFGDDRADGMSSFGDGRLDERIYADAPNYLTYQLNAKRYSVPYHPVARSRAIQTAGTVLPYAMVDHGRNDNFYGYDDLVVKTTAAELLNALINRRSKAGLQDNTRLLRYGISKRTRFDPDDSGNYYNY